jgi:type II secretory pathway component GspD/PulD (secretin)
VIVIGGLMQETETDRRAATPWVSRIPLLGRLFRHQALSESKTELVILLRAVVADDRAWKQALQETRERADSLQKRWVRDPAVTPGP